MASLGDIFVNIGAKISDFEGAMNKVETRLQGMGDSMQGLGEGMTAGITAPLGALGAVGLNTAAQISSSQSTIQASLGATGAKAQELQKVATNVWKQGFGENMGEVNQGIIKVTQNMGKLSNEDLSSVTKSALSLAKVFGADINESTAAAGVMMKNFGIDGKTAMDLITVGFQKGGDFSGELLDTMREYSPQFKSMGFSADQMTGILIEGAKAGAWNLDKVGDAVKEMNIRMKDGSKTTSDAFKGLGLDANKMAQDFAAGGDKAQNAFAVTMAALSQIEDPVKRNRIGVDLLGTQYEDLEKDVVQAMANGSKGVGDFKNKSEELNSTMSSGPWASLSATWRTMQADLAPLGDVMAQIAADYGPALSQAVADIAKWFQSLSPGVQKAIVIFGALLAAAGPVLIWAGMVVNGISTVAGAFGTLTGRGGEGVSRFGQIMNTLKTKIGTALTSARTALSSFGTTIANTARTWGSAALRGLSSFGTMIKGGFTTGLNLAKTAFTSFGTTLKSLGSGALNTVKTGFTAIGNAARMMGPVLKTLASSGLRMLVTGFRSVVTVLNVLRIAMLTNPFTLIITAVVIAAALIIMNWDKVKAFLLAAWAMIKTAAVTIWNALKAAVIAAVTALKAGVTAAWNAIKAAASAVWNAIKSAVVNAAKALYNGAKSALNSLKSAATSIWNAIKSAASAVWNAVKSAVVNAVKALYNSAKSTMNSLKSAASSIWNAIKSAASTAWNAVKSAVSKAITGAYNYVKGAASRFLSAGKGLITALIKGIKSMIGGAISLVKGAVNKIRDLLPGSDAKEGPLSDLTASGRGLFEALADGIAKRTNHAVGVVEKGVGKIRDAMEIKDPAEQVAAGMARARSALYAHSQQMMGKVQVGVATSAGTPATAGGNINIHLGQAVIREEADIKKLATELWRQKQRDEARNYGRR